MGDNEEEYEVGTFSKKLDDEENDEILVDEPIVELDEAEPFKVG